MRYFQFSPLLQGKLTERIDVERCCRLLKRSVDQREALRRKIQKLCQHRLLLLKRILNVDFLILRSCDTHLRCQHIETRSGSRRHPLLRHGKMLVQRLDLFILNLHAFLKQDNSVEYANCLQR